MSHSTLTQLALQERTRREILHKSDLIPPLPDLVARLLGVLNKKETEPADLESLLQNDQVLVAKMLAMVNSPFYGLNRTIRTIKDAVMVLGFRGVRSLVLATSTAKFLQRDFSCYGHSPKGLWLHAASVAAGSRRLAKACKLTLDEAELLFVTGLLHDIGKLLLVSYLNEAVAVARPAAPIRDQERAMIGIDHAEAGALVTAKWNLAPEIQQVIRAHHETTSETKGSNWAAIVRLADVVAHERGTGYEAAKAPVEKLQAGDLAVLGLTEETWPRVRDDLAAAMDEAVAALGSLSA